MKNRAKTFSLMALCIAGMCLAKPRGVLESRPFGKRATTGGCPYDHFAIYILIFSKVYGVMAALRMSTATDEGSPFCAALMAMAASCERPLW